MWNIYLFNENIRTKSIQKVYKERTAKPHTCTFIVRQECMLCTKLSWEWNTGGHILFHKEMNMNCMSYTIKNA